MDCVRKRSIGVLVLSGLSALALLMSPAFAKSRPKPFTQQHVTAVSDPAALELPPAPVRFFTIKQVLAKLDADQAGSRERRLQRPQLASLGDTDPVSDLAKPGYSLRSRGDDPFGLFTFRAPEGILWQKWRQLEAGVSTELKVISACAADDNACSPAARRFVKIVEAVKAREGRAQLEEVNRDINAAIRYTSDLSQHGELDRWTTPLAMLAAGRGDCEDYAIAKYVVLRQAGYPANDLKLVLVRDRVAREDHAVIAARHEGRWLVLDNRRSLLSEDAELRHFTPMFALDQDGVKLFAAPYAQQPPERTEREVAPASWIDGGEITLRGTLATDAIESPARADLPLLM